jgi:hypothetical protein
LRTVFGRVLEDIGVHAMCVAVEQLGIRVLDPECCNSLSEQFVVMLRDRVQALQAAMAVIFRLRATVEGEQCRDTSQRRQVHHQNRLGNGHDQGGSRRGNVHNWCQQFLQQRTKCQIDERFSSNTASSYDNPIVLKCTYRVHGPRIGEGPSTTNVHFLHWECHMSWL